MSVQSFAADSRERARHSASYPALVSACSNFSIQYNFSAIAIALAFMDQPSPEAGSGPGKPAYPRTEAEASLLKSLVFAGAIAGQLTMGFAGDVIGRKRAMCLTHVLSMIGSIGSALFTWGSPTTVYAVLAACRFLLGWGVGGKYPLSATFSAESSSASANASLAVTKGFFWQSPGALAPYAVGLALVAIFGRSDIGAADAADASLQFRIVLGAGAVPTFVALVFTALGEESAEFVSASRRRRSDNPFREAARHPELLSRLAGCGLSWLLFDIVIYGTSFNQVEILRSVFGDADALFDLCWSTSY